MTPVVPAAAHTPQPQAPAAVAEAWALLPDDLAERLAMSDSRLWGNLGGVPTIIRDRVNRLALHNDLTALLRPFLDLGLPVPTSVAELAQVPRDRLQELGLADVWRVRGRIVGVNENPTMHRLRTLLAVQGELHPDPQQTTILAYDPEAFAGAGRLVLALGELDSATHVAVIVPGARAAMGRAASLIGDARAIRATGDAIVSPGETLATVMWLGYDAPALDLGLTRQDLARVGAARLTADLRALRVTHEGTPRIHVIGHSYGATVASLACQEHGLAEVVEDVVLIGCPGVGGAATAVGDLNLPAGRVYVGAASADLVTTRFAGLGVNPALDDFAALRFRCEDPARGRGGVLEFADHLRYYDQGDDGPSESLLALSLIATGQGERLGEFDLLAEHRTMGRIPVSGRQVMRDPEAGRAPRPGIPVPSTVAVSE